MNPEVSVSYVSRQEAVYSLFIIKMNQIEIWFLSGNLEEKFQHEHHGIISKPDDQGLVIFSNAGHQICASGN